MKKSSASSTPANSTTAVNSTANLPPVPPANISVTQPSQLANQALPLPTQWMDLMLIVEELVGGEKAGTMAFKEAIQALMTYWEVESWDRLLFW